MSNLDKANAALRAKHAERERQADERRLEFEKRWFAVAESFDAIAIEPRTHNTRPPTVQRTLGDVLRSMTVTLSMRGFHALSLDDAEAIVATLERLDYAAATGVEPR